MLESNNGLNIVSCQFGCSWKKGVCLRIPSSTVTFDIRKITCTLTLFYLLKTNSNTSSFKRVAKLVFLLSSSLVFDVSFQATSSFFFLQMQASY